MTRPVAEWIGKTDSTPVPTRVKLRVFERDGERCQNCNTRVIGGRWQCDHITALINGGENREYNLQVLCTNCHGAKTARDVAQKAVTARKRAKHLGLHKPKGRPIPGSKASGWRKRIDGTTERR